MDHKLPFWVTQKGRLWSKMGLDRHKKVTCKQIAKYKGNRTKMSGGVLKTETQTAKTALKRHIDNIYIHRGCKSLIYVV